MMDDILDRLFYGEVSPYDDSVEDIETFRELNHKLGQKDPTFLSWSDELVWCNASTSPKCLPFFPSTVQGTQGASPALSGTRAEPAVQL